MVCGFIYPALTAAVGFTQGHSDTSLVFFAYNKVYLKLPCALCGDLTTPHAEASLALKEVRVASCTLPMAGLRESYVYFLSLLTDITCMNGTVFLLCFFSSLVNGGIVSKQYKIYCSIAPY